MRATTRFCAWVRSRGLSLHLLAGPVIGFLFLALVAPLVSITLTSFYQRGEAGVIVKSLSLQNYIEFLTTPVYLQILLVSMLIGLVVAVVGVVLGYAPACVLALNRSSHKPLLLLLIIVPFWTSFLIRTYSWVILLGSQGVVNGLLRQAGLVQSPFRLLFNRWAVVLGLTHALLPFAIMPIYAAIDGIDEALFEAAGTLGARPWAIFSEVIIPLSLPGIVAALILVFIEAMGAFITPQLLGGPQDMMISMLTQQRFLAAYDWPFGSAVAVVYLVFTGLLMFAFAKVRRIFDL